MDQCSFWVSGFLMVCIVSIISCVPIPETKGHILSRNRRNSEDIKLELQKLRRILEKTHEDKIRATTTTPIPTTTKSSVDETFNKIVKKLQQLDEGTLLEFAKVLKQLKNNEEDKEETPVDNDSVGEYLGLSQETSIRVEDEDDTHPKTNDEMLESLRNIKTQQVESTKKQPQQTTPHEIDEEEYNSFRKEVLRALERRLLKDVSLAVQYGFNPRDIITDIREQDESKKKPRSVDASIENELRGMKAQNRM